MYPELLQALGHAEAAPPRAAFVCVCDSQATDADFVLLHFLSQYVRAQWRVCLASHRRTLLHWAMIAKKFVRCLCRFIFPTFARRKPMFDPRCFPSCPRAQNINLAALERSGQLCFVDGLGMVIDEACSAQPVNPWRAFESRVHAAFAAPPPSSAASSDAIASSSAALPSQPPQPPWRGNVLIWDGVTEMLMHHGVDAPREAHAHALACVQRLVAFMTADGAGSLVALAHRDAGDLDAPLLALLRRRAALCIDVLPLETGASRSVSGQLRMAARYSADDVGGDLRALAPRHYKLTESALRVFMPGAINMS